MHSARRSAASVCAAESLPGIDDTIIMAANTLYITFLNISCLPAGIRDSSAMVERTILDEAFALHGPAWPT